MIENKYVTHYITPSSFIKAMEHFENSNKQKGEQMYFIRKKINLFGLKFSYKKYYKDIIKYQQILAVNKEYINKKIKTFKLKKKPVAKDVILSMTSYPERMKYVHYAIFSILNQDILPEKFILWLAKDEFPGGENDIPQNVLQLKKFGLEIRYCEAIKSFKKIVPALKEFPNKILVSADDDIYYPKNWLKNLFKSYKKDPTKIYAHRMHSVGVANNRILPYVDWEKCTIDCVGNIYNFPTSVGGVLYPPNALHKDATNVKLLRKLCPNQDDIWVWIMALLNSKVFASPQQCINNNLVYVNPERELGLSNEQTLWKTNIGENKNDEQLNNIIEYYNLKERFEND